MRKAHYHPHNLLDRKELRKGAGYPHEDNDCTVVALSIAGQMTYARAHELLIIHASRKERSGPSLYALERGMKKLGFEYTEFPTEYREVHRYYGLVSRAHNITLKKWMEYPPHRKGRYILSMRGHVFAVVDGVVQDSRLRGPRTNIEGHWKASN